METWAGRQAARREGLAYALADEQLELLASSAEMAQWIEGEIRGRSLAQAFPELVGMEEVLRQMARSAARGGAVEPPLVLSTLHRASPDGLGRYFDLTVEPVDRYGAALLVLVSDVTRPAHLEQQLRQERNQLWLSYARLEQTEEALRQLNQELEQMVAARTAELSATAERLQTLSARLVEVQELERHTIARELHDEIGQTLTGLKLVLAMAARSPAGASQTGLTQAQNLVNDLMARVRELSLSLRPAMLDDLGLLPALLWHVERFSGQTRIEVTLRHRGLERRFPDAIETAAYRIVQEALTNVARHARVDRAVVRLWVDGDLLGIQVEDSGVGFDPGSALAAGATSGLSGMQERARLLGGQLIIESAPGAGTCLTADLPLGSPGNAGEVAG